MSRCTIVSRLISERLSHTLACAGRGAIFAAAAASRFDILSGRVPFLLAAVLCNMRVF